MRLFEAVNLFYKKAQALGVSSDLKSRVLSFIDSVESYGGLSHPVLQSIKGKLNSYEGYSSNEELGKELASAQTEISRLGPAYSKNLSSLLQMANYKGDFSAPTKTDAPKPAPVQQEKSKPTPTPEQVSNWQIAQVNKIKSKMYGESFKGFTDQDSKGLLAYTSALLKRFKASSPGSSERNKIKETLDVLSGMSKDVFHPNYAGAFASLQNSINSALTGTTNVDKPLDGLKDRPLENSMDKLKLGPSTASNRINFLRKLVK